MYPDDVIELLSKPAATDPHLLCIRAGCKGDRIIVSGDEIRAARRRYFANCSYFDAKVGEILATLKEAEILDNTIVVVTYDHGDMLSDKNLWYKMSWSEHSAGVPLVMAEPGIKTQVWDAPCSLLGLAPTLLEFAGVEPQVHLDGISLVPALFHSSIRQTKSIGEYCAETALGYPVCMIRQGDRKYIRCATDPAQLYHLSSDQDELNNFAGNPEHAAIEQRFTNEAAERWDDAAIRNQVITSQQERTLVRDAVDRLSGRRRSHHKRQLITQFLNHTAIRTPVPISQMHSRVDRLRYSGRILNNIATPCVDQMGGKTGWQVCGTAQSLQQSL
jgi:choline-sulfatase